MFFAVFLVATSVGAVFTYPTRPLNERWQAWLLVDDQHQTKHNDGVLRRRITPKSVFIAPTFTPEDLPPCADGYSSDTMGRCVKIIKLDEVAHLEFLANKLKDQLGEMEYEEEEFFEEDRKSGPYQLNIPLTGNHDEDDDVEDGDDEATDMAIIITPTTIRMDDLEELESTMTTLDVGTTTEEPSTTTTLPETDTTTEESTTTKITTYHPQFKRYTKRNHVKFPDQPTVATLMDFIRLPGDDVVSTVTTMEDRDVQEANEGVLTQRPPLESSSSMLQNDRQTIQRKPLILRFSRKHAYVDADRLKNTHFYRSVPVEDLSFIFGYSRGVDESR